MQTSNKKNGAKSLLKQADTEFVCKLCDMMQKYPDIINWDTDGQKMIVFSTSQMQKKVLPQYFRHGNFSSFIRQLNMYNYHKLQKNQLYENGSIAFQHSIFKRGNQKNFHFIQRKKRIKEQEQSQLLFQKKNQHLLSKLNDQDNLSQTTKTSIETLLQFKFTATQSSKQIKTELETVCRELKDCRSRKITQAMKEIREKVNVEMAEQLKMSRMIDGLVQRAFLVEKENRGVFGSLIGSFYPSMHTEETYRIREMYERSGKEGYLQMASQCGFMSQMSFSEGQMGHPIFYSNPQFFSELNYQYSGEVEKKQAIDNEQQREDSISMDLMREEELEELLRNDGGKEAVESVEKGQKMKSGFSQLVVADGEMLIVFQEEGQAEDGRLKQEYLE